MKNSQYATGVDGHTLMKIDYSSESCTGVPLVYNHRGSILVFGDQEFSEKKLKWCSAG